MQVENAMVIGASNVIARHMARNDIASEAYDSLHQQMADALMGDSCELVDTPAFGGARLQTPACDVVIDHLSGVGAEDDLQALMTLLRDAAKGEDVQLRATLWISVQAEKYARHHRDDLVAQWEGA